MVSMQAGRRKLLWMAVTADKYELPLSVAITSAELAERIGIRPDNVQLAKKKGSISRRAFNGQHYKVVVVEDEE